MPKGFQTQRVKIGLYACLVALLATVGLSIWIVAETPSYYYDPPVPVAGGAQQDLAVEVRSGQDANEYAGKVAISVISGVVLLLFALVSWKNWDSYQSSNPNTIFSRGRIVTVTIGIFLLVAFSTSVATVVQGADYYIVDASGASSGTIKISEIESQRTIDYALRNTTLAFLILATFGVFLQIYTLKQNDGNFSIFTQKFQSYRNPTKTKGR